MSVEEIYQKISNQNPPIIYVSGKTSTGKSTFSRRLRDNLGYEVIELEAVLLKIIEEHGLDEQTTFRKVLYDAKEFEAKSLFCAATDQIICNALVKKRSIVIEGSIANVDTLGRILQPAADVLFLYFHPNDIEVYIRNLTKRFMESGEQSYGGLPLKFWQLVDHKAFKSFCKTQKLTESLKESIDQYAHASQKESLARLDEFRHKFEGIIVVEIG